MNPDTIVQSMLTDQFGPCVILPADTAGLDPRAGTLFVGACYVATTRPGPIELFAALSQHTARIEHDCNALYVGDPDADGYPVMASIRAAALEAAA